MGYKIYSLIALSAVACAGVWFVQPIAQDPAYHAFVDTRTLLGVPNLLNVASNLPFLFVGLAGLWLLRNHREATATIRYRPPYLVFFVGISLVAFGSGYYHLFPDNHTLVWDRLPMTIAFMSFFTLILAEFVSLRAAKFLFIPLLTLGAFSIWQWNYTESLGAGDLRLYALVQFLPMLLIPIILISFSTNLSHHRYYWWFLMLYLLAKVFEALDTQILDTLVVISGHSIKHLAAAAGCYVFYRQIKQRQLLQGESTTPEKSLET